MQTTTDAFRTFEDLEVYLRQRKAGEANAVHESFADYHTTDDSDPFADLPL